MASRASNSGGWRLARRRPGKMAGHGRPSHSINVEQAAQLAPDWGRLEVRHPSGHESVEPVTQRLGLGF